MLGDGGSTGHGDERLLPLDRRRLHAAASSGRWPTAASIVAVSLLAFASTFPLCAHGRPIVPAQRGQGEFELTVDTPEGTSLAGMEKLVDGADAEAARDVPGVAHVMPTIFERVNHSHIFIQLKPLGERKVTQEQIATDVAQDHGRASRATGRRSSCGRRSAAARRRPGRSR